MLLRKASIIPFCFLWLFAKQAKAQNKFWEKLTVRKAFETKTADDTKPAILSFTIPKDTTNSYLINAGIGYDLFYPGKKKSTSNAITAFLVYNRNSLIAKKQKNYKLGLSAGHNFDLSDFPTAAIFGSSTLQYLHNYIDTTHSIIVTSYWRPMYKSPDFLHIGGYTAAPHLMDYFLLPQLGFENQNVIAANSKSKKGYDVRFYFNIGLNIKIKKKTRFTSDQIKQNITDSLSANTAWQKKSFKEVEDYIDHLVPKETTKAMSKNFWTKLMEFSFAYAGRSAFVHHNSNFEKYTPLFTAGVNIYPLRNESFSFGIYYNNGANPIDGTPKQNFWLFSISFKK